MSNLWAIETKEHSYINFKDRRPWHLVCERIGMKHIFLFAVFLCFSACATQGKYEEKVKSWEGADVNSLIESWGPPTSTFTMPNGNIVYTYHHSNGSRATASCAYGFCAGSSREVSCDASFTADANNRIVKWRYNGNSCRSK